MSSPGVLYLVTHEQRCQCNIHVYLSVVCKGSVQLTDGNSWCMGDNQVSVALSKEAAVLCNGGLEIAEHSDVLEFENNIEAGEGSPCFFER